MDNKQTENNEELTKETPYGNKYGLKIPDRDVNRFYTNFRELIYRGKFNNTIKTLLPESLRNKKELNLLLTGKNSESYSLGFDDDIGIKELIGNSNLADLKDEFYAYVNKEEHTGLMDMTIKEIYSDEKDTVFAFILCSNKYNLMLGCGFQLLNKEKDYPESDTYIFIRHDGLITDCGSYDLESYQRDVQSITYPLHLYLRRATLNLDKEEKYQVISSFIDSEHRTNQYDRMFLGLISLNEANIARTTFLNDITDTRHARAYIRYDKTTVKKFKDCAFLVRCDLKSDEEMDALPRLDALKFLLENYKEIPFYVPYPSVMKPFITSKRYEISKRQKKREKKKRNEHGKNNK